LLLLLLEDLAFDERELLELLALLLEGREELLALLLEDDLELLADEFLLGEVCAGAAVVILPEEVLVVVLLLVGVLEVTLLGALKYVLPPEFVPDALWLPPLLAPLYEDVLFGAVWMLLYANPLPPPYDGGQ